MDLTSVIKNVRQLIKLEWAPESLLLLESVSMRYSDILHALGLSATRVVHSSTLSAALEHLEAHKLIEHNETIYQLTEAGQTLVLEVLRPAEAWGNRNRHILDGD